MNKIRLGVFLITIFSALSPVWADTPWSIVRTTCIPELGIFHIDQIDAYLASYNGPPDETKRFIEVMKEHGYFGMPMGGEFDYTCELPFGTYRIVGSQPSLKATDVGADLRVTLSLFKDDEPILRNVAFSPSFWEQDPKNERYPYFTQVLINGSDSQIDGYLKTRNKIRQIALGAYQNKRKIYDQPLVACLTKNGIFDSTKGTSSIYKKCSINN